MIHNSPKAFKTFENINAGLLRSLSASIEVVSLAVEEHPWYSLAQSAEKYMVF